MDEQQQEPQEPKQGMNMGAMIGVIAVIIIAIAGFFLLRNNSQTQVPQTTTPPVQTSTTTQDTTITSPTTQAMASSVKEITVTGSNYSFDPKTITVTKGDKVKLTFKNSNGMHDFVIDALGVKTKVIPTGQQETVEFTADKAGTYEYYCGVGNHKAMGMKGTLTVQ